MRNLECLGLLFGVALTAGGVALLWRARRWRVGSAAAVDWLTGFKRLPRAYLFDVHDRVSRKPGAAPMHVLCALGFIGVVISAIVARSFPHIAQVSAAGAGAALMTGALLDVSRRLLGSTKLSGGWYGALPYALFGIGLAGTTAAVGDMVGADVRALSLAVAAFGALHFSWGLAYGPMRHAPIGALHLIAHPRPERFRSRHAGAALAAIDVEALAERPSRVGLLDWRMIVGVDACVQCGRCEAACPAFAAGQPLNPKAFIAQVADEAGLSAPAYAGSLHPGEAALTKLVTENTLWSCTTCRACVEACPMLIEHVDTIVSYRRHAALVGEGVPPQAARVLRSLRQTGNGSEAKPSARTLWTSGLPVPVLPSGGSVDILIWQGEAAFSATGRQTLRALVEVLDAGGFDYATLGADEVDCGDLARRMGDEELFLSLARQVHGQIAARGIKRIITVDPHALHTLRNEYAVVGSLPPIQHHSEFLAAELDSGSIRPALRADEELTYHDPCYLGRYNGIFEQPRQVLRQLGYRLVEMEASRIQSRCCGGGGAAPVVDVPGQVRISDIRAADVAATGCTKVAVACPGCSAMLASASVERLQVVDIAVLTARLLDSGRAPASVSEARAW